MRVLRRALVFVDYPAEDVMATDRPEMLHLRHGLGHVKVEASMGTRLVVVADVVAQDRAELMAGDGEHMVQAVPAHGPHPTFRESVRPGRLDRRAHHVKCPPRP